MGFETSEGLPKYFREIRKSGGVSKEREKVLAIENIPTPSLPAWLAKNSSDLIKADAGE
jgi:hypothetical protein